MLKKFLFLTLLICDLASAQTTTDNFGIRFVQLGRDIRSVWQDYDGERIRQRQVAQPFGTNCDPIIGNYGNRKLMQCILPEFILNRERHDLVFVTDNNLVIKIRYPSVEGTKLKNMTSEEFVNAAIEGFSKKYSQQPVITSKPVKLADNFDDEIREYIVNCKKVLNAAVPQSGLDLDDVCSDSIKNSTNPRTKIDMSQLPMLSAKRDEILYNIKLANSKKGASCSNCNGTINTAQWGETGSNNTMKIVYTKRDLTGSYRFYTLEMIDDKAINELQNVNKSMMKNIESNVFKQ